ncbi:MAG: hypothetical protein ABH823_01665 [bacterium]
MNKSFCLTAILLVFLSFPALASDEIPVNIKADTLRYIEGSGVVEAIGNVRATLPEVTIEADKLIMDSETNIITAEGNVLMITRDYTADSDYITYDATAEVSVFDNFMSRIKPDKAQGLVYLSARELTDLGGEMQGEAGALTTCEDGVPHFYLMADTLTYYPEDKIIGYSVTLYVGDLPVLWLPMMIYPLNERNRYNWEIGHNEVEGDFIKSSWGYPWGTLYFDEMQKKGFGKGTEVGYGLAALGLGTLYLYNLEEEDTGITDWITRIDHEKQINPYTTFKFKQRYTTTYLIPSGRKDQTSVGGSLSYKHKARWQLDADTFDDRLAFLQKYSLGFNQSYQKTATNYDLSYDRAKKDPLWIRASQRFSHRRPLWSDKVMLSTKLNYYNNVATGGAPGDERLEPSYEITGREKLFTWAYRSNWYIDFDEDTYLGDESYQYLEKIPEIELKPNSWDLKIFKLQPNFGYGHYREVKYVPELGGNRDFATERYKGSLDASKTIPLPLASSISLNAGVDQYHYTPGDQMYAYRESASLNTKAFGFFKNNVTAKKGLTEGNTPFLFDKLGTKYHNLTERITFYHLNKLDWTTSAGYNWQSHEFMDVLTGLLIRPNIFYYWKLDSGWSIENRKYKDLVNKLTMQPADFLTMQFSTVSDVNIGVLKSGSAVYELYFLKGQRNQWRLKVSQTHEEATKQFKVRDIMIIKDLHCWELKYTYSDLRKEFSLTFSLKAMPDKPAGLSSGRGFYIDGFEDQLEGELNQDKAIRRY